jgi:hypothetical protein
MVVVIRFFERTGTFPALSLYQFYGMRYRLKDNP